MIRRRIWGAPVALAAALALVLLSAPRAEGAAERTPWNPMIERLDGPQQAIALIDALGSPLEEVAAAVEKLGSSGSDSTAEEVARPVQQLGGVVGVLQNLLRRSPRVSEDRGVAEALRASVQRSRLEGLGKEEAPDLDAWREPLVPALQFFCPGFFAVSGLVLGSLPPLPGADEGISVIGPLCDDLPVSGGAAYLEPGGELAFFDARTVAELVRFGAQSAFLPGTPMVDQGAALSAAAVDSNGASAFSANLYPGSLVEAVPGVVALLGFPLTLPPLYPYLARAANPGPATSDGSIVPTQTAAGYQFDGLSSRAEAPSVDAARAETAAVKLAQPGLVEIAAVHGTSSVEHVRGLVRSISQTRLQGVEIAGGFISIGEFVSTLSVANTGAASRAGIDHKVSLGGVRFLGIPVEVTDKGLVVSSVGAEPGMAEARRQLADAVAAFDLRLEVMSPVVSEAVESGGRIVEAVSPGLRIGYQVPEDVSSLPIPVAAALLNNARVELKLGYTAAFSNVTAAAPAPDSAEEDGGRSSIPEGEGDGSAATGTTSAVVLDPPAAADDGSFLEPGIDRGDPGPGWVISTGTGLTVGRQANAGAEEALPIIELRQSPVSAPLSIALSTPARRDAYVFSLVVICLGLAVVGWRTVLYHPGPERRPPDGNMAGENAEAGSA